MGFKHSAYQKSKGQKAAKVSDGYKCGADNYAKTGSASAVKGSKGNGNVTGKRGAPASKFEGKGNITGVKEKK